jgi:hypothetical protein
MRTGDEFRDDEIADPAVSARYRATASESSPAQLDRKILQEAKLEASIGAKSLPLISWLRPVTFLATAGLCVALLLEFAEYQEYAGPSGAPVDVLEAAPEFAADRTLPAPSAAEENIEPAKNVASPGNPPASLDRSLDNANDFRRAASDTAGQVRAVESAADATLQEMPRDVPKQALAASDSESQLADLPAADMPVADIRCTDEQRQDAQQWWLCIKQLRSTGLETQAQIEAQGFHDAYPEFSPQ